MKILITAATSRLGSVAGKALSDSHEVTLTDLPQFTSEGDGVISNELGHEEATDELVAGMDAVIVPGIGGHPGDASWLIDHHTRRSYNILRASVDAEVPHAIYLSTLRLLDDYEERFTVTERWRPLPTMDDELLAVHLGEYVFREFAREEPISTTVLRLGFPVVDGDRTAAEGAGNAAICTSDISEVLSRLVEGGGAGYRVIHVQSPVRAARFLMGDSEAAIGFPVGGQGRAR